MSRMDEVDSKEKSVLTPVENGGDVRRVTTSKKGTTKLTQIERLHGRTNKEILIYSTMAMSRI